VEARKNICEPAAAYVSAAAAAVSPEADASPSPH